MDKKEEEIVKEIEHIDKQIEENHVSPRTLSFNDPLTSMHYNEMLDDGDDDVICSSPTKQQSKTDIGQRPRKISERSLKLQEYKRSMGQISYNMVAVNGVPPNRKVRGIKMTSSDQHAIKNFIHDFAVRGLLPHIERLMRSISEQVGRSWIDTEAVTGGVFQKKGVLKAFANFTGQHLCLRLFLRKLQA